MLFKSDVCRYTASITTPILYSFRRCPYAMRARMALHHAGIQCELREVLLKEKPAVMLKISPKATVPVLQLPDSTVIDESLDIMLWALHTDDDWMAVDRNEMLDLISENDLEFKKHLDRYKYPQRFTAEGRVEDTCLDGMQHFHAACLFLTKLENHLELSPYLFGANSCLADVAIFPFVRQFAAVDRSQFDALPFRQLRTWLDTKLNDAEFQHIMSKQKPWQLGDKAIYLS